MDCHKIAEELREIGREFPDSFSIHDPPEVKASACIGLKIKDLAYEIERVAPDKPKEKTLADVLNEVTGHKSWHADGPRFARWFKDKRRPALVVSPAECSHSVRVDVAEESNHFYIGFNAIHALSDYIEEKFPAP